MFLTSSKIDYLEEGRATHSSILAWRIPWTEEPGGLESIGSQEQDTTETTEENRPRFYRWQKMPNHLTFSTDQNEINHMGSALKVGEEILLNMTAHMEAKKNKKTMEGNAVRFPWDMLSKKETGEG